MAPHDQYALRPGSERRLRAVQRAFRALRPRFVWRAPWRRLGRLRYWLLPAFIGIALGVVAVRVLDIGSAEPVETPWLPPMKASPPIRSVAAQSCNELRALGLAPAYRGQEGYAEHLDRDGDGIACEPYRAR